MVNSNINQPDVRQPDGGLYELYRRGLDLLDSGSFAAATVPLGKVVRSDPGNLSAREALGRALFRSGQYDRAVGEFEAVVERQPVNDYAHFCLGRALTKVGDEGRAYHHLAIASNLRPSRRDYRVYRELLADSTTPEPN